MFSKGERRFLRETYTELLRIAEAARQETVIQHCSAVLRLLALMESGPLPAQQYILLANDLTHCAASAGAIFRSPEGGTEDMLLRFSAYLTLAVKARRLAGESGAAPL